LDIEFYYKQLQWMTSQDAVSLSWIGL